MRILVTGAAGFIGSHLCERLRSEGDDLTGLDAFDTTLYDAARKERNLEQLRRDPGFRFVAGDLADVALVEELVKDQDVVVHLAALAGVRPSLRQPSRYMRTNVEGTLNVLEACRAAGVQRLVFASSSSVYGARPDVQAFTEDDPCTAPASPYAASKRAGELMCSTYRDLHGLGVTALRFFTVYGPRQRPDMAIHKFTAAMLSGQPITLYGETARDYTFIDDIIDGVVSAIRHVTPGRYAIYNLGGTRTTGLADLARRIAAAANVTPEIVAGEPQPGDVPLTWADVSRARRDLGYEPQVSLDEGLRRFLAWYRADSAR